MRGLAFVDQLENIGPKSLQLLWTNAVDCPKLIEGGRTSITDGLQCGVGEDLVCLPASFS